MLFSVHQYACGADLLNCTRNFDLIFLDIQMDGISGMEIAKKIRAGGTAGHIVFVTVLNEYVYDAFDVEASVIC
jgi:DNA-binding LytR/AlgR family response regulator